METGYQVIARRWRPQQFDEIVGQEHIVRTLKNAISGGRIAHSYLFVGPRGTGKTTSARLFAKALNCKNGPTVEPCGECGPCTSIRDGNSMEVCEAVMDVWEPTPEDPIILNLPVTVELATPNIHADQMEWICRNIKNRDAVIISLHTHNDRGTGTAATELGLMAGAQRVEGTLFGNGERTGNVDISIVALNLYTQGIAPDLDFSNINAIRSTYEKCTRMTVHDRHPYAGDLVFTAFSGSHQDAIKKGMDKMDPTDDARWQVPYLPIDPDDIGRTYKAIIRINSQSGKGGVAYVMEREFGLEMPKTMHPEFGALINRLADSTGKELTADDVRSAFDSEYIHREEPLYLDTYQILSARDDHHHVSISAEIIYEGKRQSIDGTGNGPIAAFVDALERTGLKDFHLTDFRQHAITGGSSADAVAFIQIVRTIDDRRFWGASIDGNIELAGLKALVSACNRANADRKLTAQSTASDAVKG